MASRDEQLQHLFESSRDVSALLDDRSDDIVDLMGNSDLVFQELQKRKQAIHQLLVNARSLATELEGVANDNQEQIGPPLQEVDELLDLLDAKDKELKATLQRARSLRLDPRQHHRHRPVVRRLCRQPGRDPHGRVPARAPGLMPSDDALIDA